MSSPIFSFNRHSASSSEKASCSVRISFSSPLALNPPQWQRRVSAAGDDEVDVLGEVLHEEGHRLMRVLLGYELVVIEHQYNLIGQLGELVYERGERESGEPLPHGAHSHKNIGSEVLFLWHNPTQRLYYVPPQPDRIVVLLVEGDPGEGYLGFFYLTPVGQERRLPVAGRGAYDANLAVQGVPEELEQPATDHVLGAGQRHPQLGLEDDPGRIDAWVARGVNERSPLSSTTILSCARSPHGR